MPLMFVYIIGNAEQNIFKLGMAGDPFKRLSSIQTGNPYKLSIICKICVQNKNAAALIERLGHKELSKYEGVGEWFMNVPDYLSAQFASGHYLRSLASKADVQPTDRDEYAISNGTVSLQRLTPIAKRNGLTFEDILERVEQAYDEGVPIDSIIIDSD